jgi:DNA-binding beta-propeller fold protein YncE
VSDPAVIVGIKSSQPDEVSRTYRVFAAGPHGLALDPKTRRLFCACYEKKLVVLSADTGDIQRTLDLSGGPDVLFLNAARRHLYAAVGDPGVIDVFDVDALVRIQTVPTEKGAHTIAFDAARNRVYAFLPQTHRAAVFLDRD